MNITIEFTEQELQVLEEILFLYTSNSFFACHVLSKKKQKADIIIKKREKYERAYELAYLHDKIAPLIGRKQYLEH